MVYKSFYPKYSQIKKTHSVIQIPGIRNRHLGIIHENINGEVKLDKTTWNSIVHLHGKEQVIQTHSQILL